MNVNQFFGIGHLTRDPDLKELPGGNSRVATFRLAINRSFKKDNEWVDKPTFVDCDAWNQRADYVMSRLQKGTEVYIRGRLETDEWERDGERRSKLKIYVLEVQASKGRKEKTPSTSSTGIEVPF